MQAARIAAFPIEFNENATLGIQGNDNQKFATAIFFLSRFWNLKPVEGIAGRSKNPLANAAPLRMNPIVGKGNIMVRRTLLLLAVTALMSGVAQAGRSHRRQLDNTERADRRNIALRRRVLRHSEDRPICRKENRIADQQWQALRRQGDRSCQRQNLQRQSDVEWTHPENERLFCSAGCFADPRSGPSSRCANTVGLSMSRDPMIVAPSLTGPPSFRPF